MTQSLHQRLIDKNHYYIDLANELYGMNMPYPTIRCDITGKTGGWAQPATWTVNYNPTFLKNHTEHFLVQTVGHEIAHLVAKLRGGFKHDSIWKSVMIKFGLQPDRTHMYETTLLPKYQNNTYTYTCGCRDFPITTRMHNQIIKGRGKRCRACKRPLVLKSRPGSNQVVTPIGVNPTSIEMPPRVHTPNPGLTIHVNPVPPSNKPDKKPTNKSIVAELMVKYCLANKTDAELITIIQNTLGVTRSNAGVYLYNYRKAK